MDSKLFTICVILLVASVISLSEGNAIDTQLNRQLDNVDSGIISGSNDGLLESHNIRDKRGLFCDDADCALECIKKGILLGGKCTIGLWCSCN